MKLLTSPCLLNPRIPSPLTFKPQYLTSTNDPSLILQAKTPPTPHPSKPTFSLNSLNFQTSPPINMDQTHLPENPPPPDATTTVDTTRPFRSVKEAVAIFGERLQLAEIYSPSPKPPFTLPNQEAPIWKSTPNSDHTLWKSPERGLDPSPVVMNTLKKLELELDETKRELKMLKERESETEVALASLNAELHKNMSKMAKAEAEAAGKAAAIRSSMTLRQVLSGVGGEEERSGERKYLYDKKVLKKKPVVPLVTDLFAWKDGKGIHY